MDANANAHAGGSTIALCELRSGELKMEIVHYNLHATSCKGLWLRMQTKNYNKTSKTDLRIYSSNLNLIHDYQYLYSATATILSMFNAPLTTTSTFLDVKLTGFTTKGYEVIVGLKYIPQFS